MQTIDRKLDTKEAAQLLGIRPQTLQLWRSTNRHPDLPYIKVGTAVRYRLSDLEAWMASRTVGGGE